MIARTRFTEDHPNLDDPVDAKAVEALFPETVDCLTIHLSEARDDFRRRTAPELKSQLDKLKAFLDSRTEQLELDFTAAVETASTSTKEHRRQKKEREQREIRKKHDDYKTWITETMETEDAPSIRLFAVFGNFDTTP